MKKMNETPKEVERNPAITTLWIGLIISILGVIGIIISSVILQNELIRVFLGVFITGVLILFFALILRRLRKKGINYFVIGAITAYIGFLLLALPALLATIGVEIIENYVYYILMGVGVFLIVFGFFMETYDLNQKILALIKRMRIAIRNMLEKINWKLILSPWNLTALIGLVVIILNILNILPFLDKIYYYFIGGGLILINIVFHLRQELFELVKSIARIISTIFKAWLKAIKQIPRILKAFFIWFGELIANAIKILWKGLKFLIIRNYFLIFIFGIVLFFLLRDVLVFEIRIAFTSLVCGISVIKPILDWRESFGEDVSKARLFLYKTSHKARNLIRRDDIFNCPHCNFRSLKSARKCWNCGKEHPRCLICNNPVEKGQDISRCCNCDNLYHHNHLLTWLRFRQKCPVCHEFMEDIKKEKFIVEEMIET